MNSAIARASRNFIFYAAFGLGVAGAISGCGLLKTVEKADAAFAGKTPIAESAMRFESAGDTATVRYGPLTRKTVKKLALELMNIGIDRIRREPIFVMGESVMMNENLLADASDYIERAVRRDTGLAGIGYRWLADQNYLYAKYNVEFGRWDRASRNLRQMDRYNKVTMHITKNDVAGWLFNAAEFELKNEKGHRERAKAYMDAGLHYDIGRRPDYMRLEKLLDKGAPKQADTLKQEIKLGEIKKR